jgi:motility quorum-sensing regulator/GCU-specific mRNA interferase toxin
MEKRTPHCRLAVVRQLITAGQVRETMMASIGAMSMGLSRE